MSIETLVECLSEFRPKARKDYICMASEFVINFLNQGLFTFGDYRDIVEMKSRGWKIKRGEIYLKQNNVFDGHIYTFRANIDMHYLCIEYDLYPEV